jgi:hypothetical protein
VNSPVQWPHSASRAIAVHDFRVTYLWPLRLTADGALKNTHDSAENGSGKWLDAYRDWIVHEDCRWTAVDDYYLDPRRGLSDASRYAEFAYFHPYIHDILFRKNSKSSCRILRRCDINTARVELSNQWDNPDRPAWILDVEEIQLFLFPTNIAVLAVRMGRPRAEAAPPARTQSTTEQPEFQLADALDFLDYARRVYPPYWVNSAPGALAPGLVPVSFEWRSAGGDRVGAASNFGVPCQFLKHCAEERTTPVAAHWRSLLEPLKPDDGLARAKEHPNALFYGQVEDDRLPQLAYLTVDDPSQISEGDWYRLAYSDGAGNSRGFAYGQPFLREKTATGVFYDRFWDPPAYQSRYSCVGYAFTLVANTSPGPPLREHMAQHYFCLALLAHLQKASLLGFWQRLSEIVTEFANTPAGQESQRRLYEAQQWLLQDLTDFVSRFYFIEVSNQLQALEIFKLWRDQLGIERLYDEVIEQSKFVAGVLETRTQAKNTDAQVAMARQQTRLSAIANGLLPPALAASIAQVLGSDGTDPIECWARDWQWNWLARPLPAKFALVAVLWFAVWMVWKSISHSKGQFWLDVKRRLAPALERTAAKWKRQADVRA